MAFSLIIGKMKYSKIKAIFYPKSDENCIKKAPKGALPN
jgi:hypothetical protein